MTSEPENIVLEQLRLLRADIGAMKAEVDHKLGAMTETLIGIKREIQTLDVLIRPRPNTITIAVDEHTQRLERIETRLGLDEGHH